MKKQQLSTTIASSYRYSKGVILDEDFKPFAKSPLKIKVVVVSGGKALRRMSIKLGHAVESSTYAFVDTASGSAPDKKTGKIVYTADANYFCVMVFQVHHLNAAIITHESVHAGFAIAKRDVRDPWRRAFSLDEEWIAYPAGIVARKLCEIFRQNGLLEEYL